MIRRIHWVVALSVLSACTPWSCDPARSNPLYCASNADCKQPERPMCDVVTAECVASLVDGGTPDGDGAVTGCTASNQCSVATAPICDPASHTCRGCTSSADAGMSTECSGLSLTRPLCSSSGACVECLSNADCLASRKSCDVPTGSCVACAKNADCTSGLCNASTGACADPSTLVYVSASGQSCPAGPGQGTLADPYCKVKDGLDKGAMLGETVVVFAGTYAENVTIAPSAGVTYKVSAVGVSGPTIQPTGPGPAVTLDKSNGAAQITVTLDGFTIKGATNTNGHGVLCSGAAGNTAATKLTLLRSTVSNNAQNALNASNCDVTLDQDVIGPTNAAGGIYLSGTDFTLQNLLVIGNGASGTSGSNFGGINVATTATRANIVNVTVVNNNAKTGAQAAGFTCGAQPSIINSVVVGNAGPAVSPDLNAAGCLPDHSSFVGASVAGTGTNNQDLTTCGANAAAIETALFSNPSTGDYHAKMGGSAPCTLVGLGTPSGAPTYDLDGKTRPNPPSIGCLESK